MRVEPTWVSDVDGTLENVWTDTDRTYRSRRPSTLGRPDIENTKVWVKPLKNANWQVTTFQSLPLYLEDLKPEVKVFGAHDAAMNHATTFLRDRFRIIDPRALPLLGRIASHTEPLTTEAAHELVLDLIEVLLGEEYRSPCATAIGTWGGSLYAFVNEVRKEDPGTLEMFFALGEGWDLGKRELRKTVKRLSEEP